MALIALDSELSEWLKMIGVPERCTEFKLTVRVGEIVTAEATYYPSLDLNPDGELMKATKRYRLVEIEPENAQR